MSIFKHVENSELRTKVQDFITKIADIKSGSVKLFDQTKSYSEVVEGFIECNKKSVELILSLNTVNTNYKTTIDKINVAIADKVESSNHQYYDWVYWSDKVMSCADITKKYNNEGSYAKFAGQIS